MTSRIGIDLGGTKIEGVLLENSVVSRRLRVPTPQADGYSAILDAIREIVEQLRETSGHRPPIGICTPGTLSPRTELLRNCNTLCLNGQPLDRDLEVMLEQPIAIANDANCFALAEAGLGAARGHRVVFGVILGTGVGGGIVIDGRVHEGRLRIGGEWGHHTLHPGGHRCFCGRRGCVETYLCGPALERRWREATGKAMPLAEVAALDPERADVTAWRTGLLSDFGIALANVINILDPDVVVLGGGLSKMPFLYSEGAAAVRANIFSDLTDTPILENELGDSAGVFGAALL